MVRINFFTFISILILGNAQAENIKKINTEEIARATLDEVILETDGKFAKSGLKYSCKAQAQQVEATSDQEATGSNISLVCKIDNANLNAQIENVAILPYIQDKQTYYFLDASNLRMQFDNVSLMAQSCTTNTKNLEVILYNCSGTYINHHQLIGKILFFSTNPMKIKETQIYIKDISIRNEFLNFLAQDLNIDFKENINGQNIQGTIYDDIKIYIGHISIAQHTITGRNIKLEKDDIELTTEIARMTDNHLVLPKTIKLKSGEIKLKAKNGRQKGENILFNEISFKMKNIYGFCESGYFDIKDKALILENGTIKLNNRVQK